MRGYYSFNTEYGRADEFFKAVLSLDKTLVAQLKANGQTLTEDVKNTLVNGGGPMVSNKPATPFWYLYLTDLESIEKEDFAWISRTFFEETGEPLYFSDSLEHVIAKYFFHDAVFTALLECYNLKKLNKTRVLKELARRNNVPILELCAAHGWLKQAKKRDELIEYASAQNAAEATAWLLDFKNRTADIAAERVKAEKKAKRELNAAPDSALELGKRWSWKKQEDGTLIITSYKGEQTEVTVPVKIGNNIVTAIGEFALSPNASRLKPQYISHRNNITKITVPSGIKTIGRLAFGGLKRVGSYLKQSPLKEIILPETLEFFADRHAALNAPIIVAYTSVAVIPHMENARIYCIKNNINYRFADEEKIHIPSEEVIASDPLFSAILEGDEKKVRELKKDGAVLTDYIKDCLLHEYSQISVIREIKETQINPLFRMAENTLLNREFILKTLAEELGEPMSYPFGITRNLPPKLLDIQLACSNTKHLNRIGEMKRFVDENKLEHLAVCAKNGWLKLSATRDKMIQYASDNNKTEALAWLLDFKNRTADVEAERKRAEKRRERELNAAPNSAAALRRIWSFKKQEDGTLVITSYKGDHTEISVPSVIGKDTVAAIGEKAFSPNAAGLKREQAEFRQTVRHIRLPDGIRSIGEGAFRFCEALSEFEIPDSVSEISDEAFIYCSGLAEIVIPETVKKLGNSMFAGCTALRSVKLPESVTAIGDNMFSNCRALQHITLPKGIQSIGKRAFSSCAGLLTLDLPDSVSRIGSQAFSYCSSLTEIAIPNTVTEIGNGVFEWCTALRSIKLSDNISEIGNYMFTRCEALQSITLPDAVQSIKMGAFSGCVSLREIVVPPSVKDIGEDAFKDSDNVTVIAEPNSFAEEYCKKYNIKFKLKGTDIK